MGLVLIAISVSAVVGLISNAPSSSEVKSWWPSALWRGWNGGLGKVPIAADQEASAAEVCRQTKRAAGPLGEHALGVGRLFQETNVFFNS